MCDLAKKIFYINLFFIRNFIPFKKIAAKLRAKNMDYLKKNYFNFVSCNNSSDMLYEGESQVILYKLKNVYLPIYKDFSLACENERVIYKENFNDINAIKTIEIFPPKFDKEPINVEKACNLAICWSDNYWHFTFEIMTKLLLMEKNGYDGKYFLFDRKYIRELLDFFKIDKEKIIYVRENQIYKVSELTILEPIGGRADKNLPLMKILRNRAFEILSKYDLSKYPKNIYVKRIGTRKISNESDFIDILKENKFKVIIPEEYSVEEQIKHFYAADICLTPHGANSTNAIYMKKNSVFIEYFGHNYVIPLNAKILSYFGINHKIYVETINVKDGWTADFNVDVDTIKAVINVNKYND